MILRFRNSSFIFFNFFHNFEVCLTRQNTLHNFILSYQEIVSIGIVSIVIHSPTPLFRYNNSGTQKTTDKTWHCAWHIVGNFIKLISSKTKLSAALAISHTEFPYMIFAFFVFPVNRTSVLRSPVLCFTHISISFICLIPYYDLCFNKKPAELGSAVCGHLNYTSYKLSVLMKR